MAVGPGLAEATVMTIASLRLGAALAVAAFALPACVELDATDDDPAGALGDDEWHDDGPTGADVDSDRELAVEPPSGMLSVAPRFQLPFPCGQVWAGQTRTNHSPAPSVDFNRPDDLGDAVAASAAGVVTRVENLGATSYGRWIEVSHGNGYTTRYAHLASQRVARGQSVRQGQVIGTVGSTGGSTGPHLHFEQRYNGAAIRASFDGTPALYWGTRNYTSKNACGGSGGVAGRIDTAGAPLTVRSGPGTGYAAVGSVADGTHVTIRCQKRGTSVTGTFGTSTLWDQIGDGFVADAYVATGSDGQVAPTCP